MAFEIIGSNYTARQFAGCVVSSMPQEATRPHSEKPTSRGMSFVSGLSSEAEKTRNAALRRGLGQVAASESGNDGTQLILILFPRQGIEVGAQTSTYLLQSSVG